MSTSAVWTGGDEARSAAAGSSGGASGTVIFFAMRKASDGSYTASLSTAAVKAVLYASNNGAAFAAALGTVTEVGFGVYYYTFDLTEVPVDGMALLASDESATIDGVSYMPVREQVEVGALDALDSDLTNTIIAAKTQIDSTISAAQTAIIAEVDSQATAINAHTDSQVSSAVSTIDAHTDDRVTSAEANIETAVNGHIDTEAAAINAHTDARVTTAESNIETVINTTVLAAIAAAQAAINDHTDTDEVAIQASITAAYNSLVTNLPAFVWSHTIGEGTSARQIMMGAFATLLGDALGLSTEAETFYGPDGTTILVSGTMNDNGDRVVTLNLGPP